MAEYSAIDIRKKDNQDSNNQLPPTQNNNRQQPPKTSDKKIWYFGCGCGVFIFVAFLALMYYAFTAVANDEAKDLRNTYLRQDMKRITSQLTEKDSLSQFVKMCLDLGVSDENELDKDAFKYFTRRNGNKLLVIVEIKDMQDIEASSRKGIIEIIEECLSYQEEGEDAIDQYYICIEGKWNTLLVKTPYGSDLGGKFADDKLLLPFYNEYVKDSLPSLE